jgi:hypothetical protein
MKVWKQTTEEIKAIIATGKPLKIVSGEGENGTAQDYAGAKTVRAIKSRLTRERCGGDRWARVDTNDGMALAGVI